MADGPLVQNAAETISWHLDEIRKLFRPGVKLTFLARRPEPELADGRQDMLLTEDDLDAITTAIGIRKDGGP
jgi:hypothetical protein